jgi:hypothetical protein
MLHFQQVLASSLSASAIPTIMQATEPKKSAGEANQALHNLFAADLHTVSLSELIERAGRGDAKKTKNVVIYNAACSRCLCSAQRLEGSYLRTFCS